jgi:hypothetical protein
MAHVTFIHGIANKPPPAALLRIWREALANAADPLPLGDLGVSSDLVYWADLMYDKPDDDVAAHEGVLENTPAAVDGGGGAAAPQPRTAEEAAFLTALRQRMRFYGCCQATGVSFAASNGLPLFQTAQVMRKSLRASITTACVLLNPLALRAW